MGAGLRTLQKGAHTGSGMGELRQEKPVPSIAVLALDDMSQEKDQDYFCEGLAEELINAGRIL